ISFANFRQNIGALGGGNVTVAAAGDVIAVSAAVPTTGTVSGASTGTPPDRSQPIVLGGGNLLISAGGDVVGGVYDVGQGQGVGRAGGELRAAGPGSLAPVLALGDGAFDVVSGRGLMLAGVLSPTLVPQSKLNVANSFNDPGLSYFSSYAPDSA